jgi:hypothetical protein
MGPSIDGNSGAGAASEDYRKHNLISSTGSVHGFRSS